MHKAPCKNCPDRELGCHATCPKYAEYANEQEAVRQARAEQNKQMEYIIERNKKLFGQGKKIKSRRGR